ncbi:hypothetical protein H0A36_14170 [Endozoicomonas sp. SM1973]|uniref:Uncharacterized protein n=1 Tax=Spartinivicinus marinus TaxID=2994442 RepID=A0A853I6A5_9GAMM|nr:hypothetical protein [Spartinivicinus marinus]MCX4028495.1 hypothetical protein [Spartinivicinus marinus]NYZ67162.1 hypothetical protein [Spartinivicinus marinus]
MQVRFVILFVLINSLMMNVKADVFKHHLSGACVVPQKLENNSPLIFDYDACNPKTADKEKYANYIIEPTNEEDGSFYIKHKFTGFCIAPMSNSSEEKSLLILSENCDSSFVRTPNGQGSISLKGSEFVISSSSFLPKHLNSIDHLVLYKPFKYMKTIKSQIFYFSRLDG